MSREPTPWGWLNEPDRGAWTPAYRRAVRRRAWIGLAFCSILFGWMIWDMIVSPAWAASQ